MKFLIQNIIILIILNFDIINAESVFSFPLKIDEIKDDKNFDITQLENSGIYTEINIGKPNQKIKLYLSFEYYLIYIFNHGEIGSYNYLNSDTYKNISKTTYYSSPFERGFESNETISLSTFNNSVIDINDFSFDLVYEFKKDIDYKEGVIGLKLFDHTYRGDPTRNIIVQLKKRHIIESYGWNIKFKNNGEGFLNIGAYPHEYDKKNYATEYFKNILSGWRSTGVYWEIEFTNIITGYGNYIEKTKKCEMQIEKGFIFATDEYFDLVKKEFFNEKIEKKECFLDTSISSKYLNFKYFYCLNYDTIKQFKGIHFKHNSLDKDFFFDYNDLFTKKNEKYYFLIVFRPSTNVNWIIGYPFFKKYEFVFQPDQKIIGTYINYPNNDDNKNNDINNSMIVLICCVGLLFVIIVILSIFLYRVITKKFKKKRANELLDDNYDYSTPVEDNKFLND